MKQMSAGSVLTRGSTSRHAPLAPVSSRSILPRPCQPTILHQHLVQGQGFSLDNFSWATQRSCRPCHAGAIRVRFAEAETETATKEATPRVTRSKPLETASAVSESINGVPRKVDPTPKNLTNTSPIKLEREQEQREQEREAAAEEIEIPDPSTTRRNIVDVGYASVIGVLVAFSVFTMDVSMELRQLDIEKAANSGPSVVLTAQLSDAQKALESIRTERDTFKGRAEVAELSFRTAESRITELESGIGAMQKTMADLQKSLAEERTKSVRIVKQFEAYESERSGRAQELESQVERLSGRLRAETAAAAALKMQLLQLGDAAEQRAPDVKADSETAKDQVVQANAAESAQEPAAAPPAQVQSSVRV